MHDFGSRIRPDEITPELREQLVSDSRLTEALLQAATFVGAVAVSLLLSLVYRWHGEASGSEWRPIALVVTVAAIAMIGIRIWFHWENHFLKAAPVTIAEVEEIEVVAPDHHYLKLKLDAPQPAVQEGEVVVAEVHSSSPAFNENLHPGDLVSVIYEPENHEHVQVVEEEHLTHR